MRDPSAPVFGNVQIRWKVNNVQALVHFVRGVDTRFSRSKIPTLRKAVPVVARYADDVSDFQIEFVVVRGRVLSERHLTVSTLTTKVVDVIERSEILRRVRMQRLHDLVRHPTDLRTDPVRK